MNKSDSIAKIAVALNAAQSSIGAAEKGATNPFFNSKYADLGSVMAICKEPLLLNGISVLQLVGTDGPKTTLETMLLHTSGEYISSQMPVEAPKRMVFPKKGEPDFAPYLTPDPQHIGSAISYARRHALQAMLFIPSVDDDAEWAERALSRRPTPEVNAEAIKSAIEASGGKVVEIEPAPVSSSDTDKDWWKKIECHKGAAGGAWLGKKLGEMNPHALQSLHDDFALNIRSSATKKDKALAEAVVAAIKAGAGEKSPERPVVTPQPEKAPETPKEEEKPATVKPDAPQATPAPSVKWDWRKVKVHFGKEGSPLLGKELGALSDDHLLNCYVFGIPKCLTDSAEDKAFVAGVNAGMKEKNLITDEIKKRREVVLKLTALGIPTAEANKILIEAQILGETDTVATCSETLLDYLLANWPTVAETLQK